MHESERLENSQGPGPRRGKRLPPIQTSFTPDPVQNVQRPPPVETVIYKTSPERPIPSDDPPISNRRASKNFLGLFNRSKSVRDFQSHDSTTTILEGDESNGRNPSYSSGMSGSRSLESKPKKSASTRRERPQRSVMTTDPLPLFQAYSQAVKYSTLPAPTVSADSILKLSKQAHTRRKSDFTVLDSVSYGTALPVGDDVQEEKNKLKRGAAGPGMFSWTTKTFVLTPLGFLLQYAGSGHHDRLPEKIMQLTSDSAAFASDAIPGKHWVLQVSSSFSEEGAATGAPSKSVFSKFSGRAESKRFAGNFLLVMESAEDMNSWLVSVRKEIQALGGQSYRPDEVAKKDPAEVIQQLRERPSRRFLIQKNPDLAATQGDFSPKSLSRDNDNLSAIDSESANSAARPFLWHTETGMSEASQATVRPNELGRSENQIAQGPQNNFKNGINNTPASLQPSNSDSGPLLKWELPANFTPSFAGTTIGIDLDLRRESVSSVPSLSSQGRSHRSLSEHSDTQAPNFSLPTFSHRLSHSIKSGSTVTPPASSGSTYKEGTSPNETRLIGGELPTIVMDASWDRVTDASEVGIAISHDPSDWEDIEELQPIIPPTFKSSPPKRLSSLENSRYSLFPSSRPQGLPAQQQNLPPSDLPSPRRYSAMDFPSAAASKRQERLSYLPPPHPPPTGALPAIPTNQTPAMEPPSTPSSKLRRPASMQIRPSSRSNANNRVPAPPNAALALPMTVRERRSFVARLPSHMLGPPILPPPSDPLPDIPQAKVSDTKTDSWSPTNAKMEMVHA